MWNRRLFIVGLVLGAFLPLFPAHALDVLLPFSLPAAPDAGQIRGLTVFRGVLAAALNNGTVKLYDLNAGDGEWSSIPLSEFMEQAEGLQGLTALEQDCAPWGLEELSLVSLHARGPFVVEERQYDLGPGTPLFTETSTAALANAVSAGALLSEWCFLGRLIRTSDAPGEDLLSWETPEAQGTLVLRGPSGGLLDDFLPAAETVGGLELTSDENGALILLAATDEAVYAASFTEAGMSAVRQELNHVPRFGGATSTSCTVGEGPVVRTVFATDADGDPVSVAQTAGGPGFAGNAIVFSCAQPGVYEWTFSASDGRTDPGDLPTATYRITATINHPPLWSDFTVSGAAGVEGALPPASDPDGDPLTYCLGTCGPGGPLEFSTTDPIWVRPDGSYVPARGGTLAYPVAVSDGRLETVVTGTFEIAACPSPAAPGGPYDYLVLGWRSADVYVPEGSCGGNAPCTGFGTLVYQVCIPAGTTSVNFQAGTLDFKYDADMIVMHGDVPPDSLHPFHPESPFYGVLSLKTGASTWNPAAELDGHRYYWKMSRGPEGSSESWQLQGPPPGWYYIKLMNISAAQSKLFVQVN